MEAAHAPTTFEALSRRSTWIHHTDWRQSEADEKAALAHYIATDRTEGKAESYDVF